MTWHKLLVLWAALFAMGFGWDMGRSCWNAVRARCRLRRRNRTRAEANMVMNSPFRWRDLRDAGIGFSFWPLHWWPWFEAGRDDDQFGGRASFTLGPLVLHIDYNAHDGPFGRPLPGMGDEKWLGERP